MGLKDNFYTAEFIAKVWESENMLDEEDKDKEIKKVEDKITRQFRTILKELGFNDDEIKWYKSSSNNGGSGPFIFSSVNTPYQMKELFKIYKEAHMNITSKERDKIIECLTDMLPLVRSMEDVKYIHKIDGKISAKRTKKMIETAEKEPFEDFDFSKLDEIHNSARHKKRVAEIVCGCYVKEIDMRIADFFHDKIFVTIDAKQDLTASLRQKIYEYQYRLIQDWTHKFDFIMKNAEICRIAERYQNLYGKNILKEIPNDDRKDYCETGKTANKELKIFCQDIRWIGRGELYRALMLLFQKESQSNISTENAAENGREEIIKAEEECYEKCQALLTAVSKHSLQKTSKEDFEYIMNYALEE